MNEHEKNEDEVHTLQELRALVASEQMPLPELSPRKLQLQASYQIACSAHE